MLLSAHQCSALMSTSVSASAPQCPSVLFSAPQCSSMLCSALQCSTVLISALQCSSVLISALQCSAVLCNAPNCWRKPSRHECTLLRNTLLPRHATEPLCVRARRSKSLFKFAVRSNLSRLHFARIHCTLFPFRPENGYSQVYTSIYIYIYI